MFEVGQIVGGDFRIIRPLSAGGMGQVFVAEQISTGAQRALKAIHRELVNQPSLRQRFEQEARVVARIPSDHVVQVVAAGIDGPSQAPWLAMELLNGRTLDDAVSSDGPFEPAQVVEVMNQLCHALSAAHGAGVVHRDIKPENIFLAESRRTSGPAFFAKVLDFGIARVRAEAGTQRTDGVGTPLWMSPEQTSTSANIGPWTDIWPLGLIAFWMLTGGQYFWRGVNAPDSMMSLLREILLDPIAPASLRAEELGAPGRAKIGPAFDAWFARCVCRETAGRFPSADVAAKDLARALLGNGGHLPMAPRTSSDLGIAATAVPEKHRLPTPLPDVAPKAEPGLPGMTPGFPHVRSIPSPDAPGPRSSSRPLAIVAGILVGLAVLFVVIGLAVTSYLARSREKACAVASAPDTPGANACRRLCAEAPGSKPCLQNALLESRSGDRDIAGTATDALRALCQRGVVDACTRAAFLYAFPLAEGIAPDPKKAMTLARRACESYPKACGLVGIGVELSWDSNRDEESGSLYARACSAGDPFACAYEASFASRRSPPTDPAVKVPRQKALAALEPACEGGDASACAEAGAMAESEDVKKAERLDRKACDAGDALGCNNLGSILAEGRTTAAAPAQALALFTTACLRGEPAGCNNIGAMKSGLLMVKRVGPRGATVYKLRCQRAFELGCAAFGASLSLWPDGSSTLDGKPGLGDAADHFDTACSAGLQPACVTLGAMTLIGQGTEETWRGRATFFGRLATRVMLVDAGKPARRSC